MTLSTRHLSILSLVISFAALGLAVVAFNSAPVHHARAPFAASPREALQNILRTADAASPEAAIAYYLHRPADAHYTHPETGLSFDYPTDFTLEVFPDEGGEIILATNPAYNLGFQIFIQPFDEPGPLTLERIRRDLPEFAVINSKETILYDDTPVLGLLTSDPVLGTLSEEWFIRGGYLYQVTMYAPEPMRDPWLRQLALGFFDEHIHYRETAQEQEEQVY